MIAKAVTCKTFLVGTRAYVGLQPGHTLTRNFMLPEIIQISIGMLHIIRFHYYESITYYIKGSLIDLSCTDNDKMITLSMHSILTIC